MEIKFLMFIITICIAAFVAYAVPYILYLLIGAIFTAIRDIYFKTKNH